MKYFSWNPEKNEWLKIHRNISFEVVVLYIVEGGLLDILEHPNPERYRGQRIFLVNIDNYVYLVPFIETNDEIFLKTVIPSPKATRAYLRRNTNEQER